MKSLFASPGTDGPFATALDAELELGAYEALWCTPSASFSTIARKLGGPDNLRPSDFVSEDDARTMAQSVLDALRKRLKAWFGVKIYGEMDYPSRLRDAQHPVEFLYYQGSWNAVSGKSVAIVGTRKPSSDGLQRARSISRSLIEDGFTLFSGLAEGIDTEVHKTALKEGGATVAILGTTLDESYPKENSKLQHDIAERHLVVSQVPYLRYHRQNPSSNRFFFPERNKTMSALTEATIIVEAGETSGTLIQAREALRQGRKLFILNSCFEAGLKWPEKFERQGAIRVRDYEDVRRKLIH